MISSVPEPSITFLVLSNGMIMTITCDITHTFLPKSKIKKEKRKLKNKIKRNEKNKIK